MTWRRSQSGVHTPASSRTHDARRFAEIVTVGKMSEKGYNNAAIAHELGLSESTVRRILDT